MLPGSSSSIQVRSSPRAPESGKTRTLWLVVLYRGALDLPKTRVNNNRVPREPRNFRDAPLKRARRETAATSTFRSENISRNRWSVPPDHSTFDPPTLLRYRLLHSRSRCYSRLNDRQGYFPWPRVDLHSCFHRPRVRFVALCACFRINYPTCTFSGKYT